MQLDDARELQRKWKAQGSLPCDHPELEREYHLSSHTGDEVCTTCGESFWPQKLREMGR